MHTRIHRLALVCVVAACSACASLPPAAENPALAAARWHTHRQALAAITHFELNGRAAAGGGVNAELRWKQFDDGHFEIRLAGPFGAGAVAISGLPNDVEIRSKDGVEQARDPELWLQQRAGWTFPVDGLRWWALGLPAPDSPARTKIDTQGRLAVLEQDGWTLNYREYQDVHGLALPRRFEASCDRIALRILVDRWSDIADVPAPAAAS